MNRIPPRLAMISNLTGYGRCSLAVAVPVVSAMGVQACPIPTALYSNHLGFPTCFHKDLNEEMEGFFDGFARLSLSFDGIYYGFVGNVGQITAAETFFQSQPQAKILLDPAMGDHGKMYSSLTQEHCSSIRKLIPYSHILTPNLTEACLLTDTPFGPDIQEEKSLRRLAEKLHCLGAKQVVITGIPGNFGYVNFLSDGCHFQALSFPGKGKPYHGTGDLFAAVLAADMLTEISIEDSIKKASAFVGACVAVSEKAGVPEKDGVLFENCLSMLVKHC